ncbi:zinc ribbon domain-containing protein, partial [Succinivibrio dextrinosolvens]|uniref:zinc ribbon domain-containing protein n=1 Tax=Succinivibrio dextrinosolvens TaxID=83771 RepID=UPI0004E248A4
MKNCSNCGAIISNSEARFCHVCGRPLEILQTDSNSFLSTLINPNIVRVVEILSEKYPNVLYPPPKEKAYKIRSNCKINPDIKLISLVDATVFGSCDEGVAFTNIGIFNKSMFLAPCFISWEEFSNCTLKLNKLSVDVISEYNKISLDISRASIKVPIFYNFLVELREEIKKLLNTTQIRENQTGSKIKNNSIDGVPSESCDCTNLNETVNKDIESENTLIDKSKQKKEEDTSSNVDQNINENRSSGLRNFYGKVSSFVTDNFSSSKKAKEDFPPKTSHNNSKENDSEFVEKHESDKKTIDDEAKQKQKEE